MTTTTPYAGRDHDRLRELLRELLRSVTFLMERRPGIRARLQGVMLTAGELCLMTKAHTMTEVRDAYERAGISEHRAVVTVREAQARLLGADQDEQLPTGAVEREVARLRAAAADGGLTVRITPEAWDALNDNGFSLGFREGQLTEITYTPPAAVEVGGVHEDRVTRVEARLNALGRSLAELGERATAAATPVAVELSKRVERLEQLTMRVLAGGKGARVAKLRPGDVVFIHTSEDVDPGTLAATAEALRSVLPETVTAAILAGAERVEVVRPAATPPRQVDTPAAPECAACAEAGTAHPGPCPVPTWPRVWRWGNPADRTPPAAGLVEFCPVGTDRSRTVREFDPQRFASFGTTAEEIEDLWRGLLERHGNATQLDGWGAPTPYAAVWRAWGREPE